MGDEVGAWFSRFLEMKSLRVFYMAPNHKPRLLMDDRRWTDMTTEKDEVVLLTVEGMVALMLTLGYRLHFSH
jgi:hypothetical protein